MRDIFLRAPSSQLDDSVKQIIDEKWDNNPTAIQILEVLDYCVHTSTASSFVIKSLNIMLEAAIKDENTSYEDIIQQAVWRQI